MPFPRKLEAKIPHSEMSFRMMETAVQLCRLQLVGVIHLTIKLHREFQLLVEDKVMAVTTVLTIDIEQVIDFLDTLLSKRYGGLDRIQKSILRCSWQGMTYEEMETVLPNYCPQYIKTNLAPKLWQKMTETLQEAKLLKGYEKVSKKNLRIILTPIVKRHEHSNLVGQMIFNRFKVLRLKSKTEYQNIYIGEDAHLVNHPCLIKHLKPQYNQKMRDQFQREANALYELGMHGQIPRLLAHFDDNMGCFLVHEFIQGVPLNHQLHETEPSQPWSETEVIMLLREVLDIIDFIHSNNIIHRDIRPSNLLRQTNGKIFLINLVSTKQIDNTHQRTFWGTQGYMAPEQSHGTPLPCSDIFSVAMLAIQALTGLPPIYFNVDYEQQKILWHEQLSISPKLATLLDKMGHFDVKNRYSSVKEVLKDFSTIPSGYS